MLTYLPFTSIAGYSALYSLSSGDCNPAIITRYLIQPASNHTLPSGISPAQPEVEVWLVMVLLILALRLPPASAPCRQVS